jgi:hypothetical protein
METIAAFDPGTARPQLSPANGSITMEEFALCRLSFQVADLSS